MLSLNGIVILLFFFFLLPLEEIKEYLILQIVNHLSQGYLTCILLIFFKSFDLLQEGVFLLLYFQELLKLVHFVLERQLSHCFVSQPSHHTNRRLRVILC